MSYNRLNGLRQGRAISKIIQYLPDKLPGAEMSAVSSTIGRTGYTNKPLVYRHPGESRGTGILQKAPDSLQMSRKRPVPIPAAGRDNNLPWLWLSYPLGLILTVP
ncbi:hypothetical protein N7456_011442 [Penicillium angulare]|uniref:Uncharacterized protein n=1 Tax=Penicillium angulare TaxID=116970 RepID=A0A9W9K066_9EURO|nr:hypothetical protein N7456_011442 [Penicillium angulare]